MKKIKKPNGLIVIILLSFAAGILFTALGAYIGNRLNLPGESPVIAVLAFILLAMILSLLAMLIAGLIAKRKAKRVNSAAEMRDAINKEKDSVRADHIAARKKLRSAAVRVIIYDIYKGLVLCFLAFMVGFSTKSVYNIAASFAFIVYFARFFLNPNEKDLSDCQKEEEYPELYALARKAAKTLKIDNDLVIYVNSNCSTSVSMSGKTVVLFVGAAALDILTSEELYVLLLHEFAHVRNDAKNEKLEDSIFVRLSALYSHFLFKHTTGISWITDSRFFKEYASYRLFATIIAEQNADNIFTEYCDAKTAGNALTKIVLNDDFMRELPRYLKAEELYGEPEPVGNYLGIVTALFRKKFPERMAFWIDLHKKELLPNVSSHPLLRDRLAKIGVSLDDVTPELPGNDPSGSEAEYRAECAKAITYCDGRIFEQQRNSYLEDRRRSYLDPLKRIREWERGGRQLTPDTFKQICADLDALGRFEEEEELCDRAMEEFTEEQQDHALFIKGLCLLDKYDERGIDFLYKSTNNPNYIDDVTDVVGKYVNLLGLSERRDEYRSWVVDITQQKIDKFDKMDSLSAFDRLESEALEGTMLNDLIDYFLSVGQDSITRIYLVRKVITDDFFTSYFLIDFADNTPPSVERDVMDKIFERLDTGYDWQFCLDRYGRKFAAAIAKVPDSCVYDKEKGYRR